MRDLAQKKLHRRTFVFAEIGRSELGSLQSAIEIRNAINDILGRYDCNPEYYENDPRIDATCAILAENAVTFGCREGAALAAEIVNQTDTEKPSSYRFQREMLAGAILRLWQ